MANGKNGTAGKPAAPQQRWWQWILLYPTLGVSLFSAAPEWIDKAKAAYLEVGKDSYQAALRENQLWQKNTTCAAAPYAWYGNPKEVRVDATICDSGDVYVRATSPDGQVKAEWVAVDEMFTADAGGMSVIPPAKAGAISPGRSLLEPGDFAVSSTNQYQNMFVVCQKFLGDKRMLLRHVRADTGICYDELIDTFNGNLTRRTQVPCRNTC
jgi:hypothetical protein